MKLLFCKACGDVFAIGLKKWRFCECKATSGRYLDNVYAEYRGADAIPLGFANGTFAEAVKKHENAYWGERFDAFVIEQQCPTFRKVK